MSLLEKRLASFRYAFRGIAGLFQTQFNAKIHLVAVVVVVAAGFYFNVSATEWCILLLAIMAVLVTEGLNTALEWLCDRIAIGHDEVIARVKDVAAGSVLLAAILAVVIGILIFLPYLRAGLE